MRKPGKTRFLVRMGARGAGALHCEGYARTPTDRENAKRGFYRTRCGRPTKPTDWLSPPRRLALRLTPLCAVCFPDGLEKT